MASRLMGLAVLLLLSGFYFFLGLELGKEAIMLNQDLLTPEEQLTWEQDINHLIERMELIHPSLYFSISETQFKNAADDLISSLPTFSNDQVIVEIMKLVALINDGHTWMLLQQEALDYSILPLRVYQFADGIFVTDAVTEHAQLTGSQLIRIGDTAIEDVVELMNPLISRDNEMTVKEHLPQYLLTPEVLKALGIIDDQIRVRLTFQDRVGDELEVAFTPVSYDEYFDFLQPAPTFSEIFPMMLPQREHPLYLSTLSSNFWLREIENQDALYIQYNAVQPSSIIDGSATSIAAFSNEVSELLDENDFSQVIVDLRHNLGGNINTFGPLLSVLSSHDSLQIADKLYLIVGRRTFSAAGVFTDELRVNPFVTLVGEPSGSGLNFYADNQGVILPNSRLEVRVSTREFNTVREDERAWHEPDIWVELSSEDYFGDVDRVLEEILELE